MIRKALTAALLIATVAAFAPASADPPPPAPPGVPSTDSAVRCVVHDYKPQCGYRSDGDSRLWSFRAGPWVARIYRGSQMIWTVGGSFATTMAIPAEAGDRVQVQLLFPHRCELPVLDVDYEYGCNGSGAVLLVEGGPQIPYLP